MRSKLNMKNLQHIKNKRKVQSRISGKILEYYNVEKKLIKCQSIDRIWLSTFNYDHLNYLLYIDTLFCINKVDLINIATHLSQNGSKTINIEQNMLLVLLSAIFFTNFFRTLFIFYLVGRSCKHCFNKYVTSCLCYFKILFMHY